MFKHLGSEKGDYGWGKDMEGRGGVLLGRTKT